MPGETYPHVRVRGAPFERGVQYGERTAPRVRRSVAAYEAVFRSWAGTEWSAVREMARAYLPAIEAFDARYVDEMRGIAAGAGVDLEDVLAINVRTEVMFSAKARQAAPRPSECTTLAVLPAASANGHTLIGQNWDWLVHSADTVVVLEVEQNDGPDFVTVVEAGLLAKFGMNSAGLGIATNAMASELDVGEPAIPYHVALRALHEAPSISGALAKLQAAPRASSANYMLAQADGLAVDIEALPGDYSRLLVEQPDEGVLAHTNHFISSRFAAHDVGLWLMPDSPFRLQSVLDFLRSRATKYSPETLQEAFSLHVNHPLGVCSHRDEGVPVSEQEATMVSGIMDLAERQMWLADGNPCTTGYRRLDYSTLLGA